MEEDAGTSRLNPSDPQGFEMWSIRPQRFIPLVMMTKSSPAVASARLDAPATPTPTDA